ncbi:hypothetical protein ACFVVU_37370 [Kitasatospora sp. NPDC057965]|uniref:hypothetical protein n=1 Tax=Kitasatospora sp. NPDC057965 TaxID=3346291 RepID=UPI0036DF2393
MNTPDGRDPETPRFTNFRFGHDPQPAPEPAIVLAVPHPDPLTPRGIAITCALCGAGRDWLLIQVNGIVFVRCRCAHEWQEPDLEGGDVDIAHTNGPEREWTDFDEMYRGLGFDGLFRMTYLG